jgi:hypothetical protein
MAQPRSGAERRRHVLELLESEMDAWVATADAGGRVCQIPLSFRWDGEVLVLSTPTASATGRNLAAGGQVRIALGTTRDVVLIEGSVRVYTAAEVPAAYAEGFAAKVKWDPRGEGGGRYGYYLVSPVKVQSWREENELRGRTLMREGAWLY